MKEASMWQVNTDRCAWRQIRDRVVVLDLTADSTSVAVAL